MKQILTNDEKYVPRIQGGKLFPAVKNLLDRSFYVHENLDVKDIYVNYNGELLKTNVTKRDTLEVDTLITKNLFANRFTFRQTSFQNGDLMIPNGAGVVESAQGNEVVIKDQSGFGVCAFEVGDLIEAKTVNPDTTLTIRNPQATVTKVVGTKLTITYYSTAEFKKGDEVYSVGSATDTSRQDSMYFSTNRTDTPYFDVYDGVNTFDTDLFPETAWGTIIPKVRIGLLTGIHDDDFGGDLLGYGIYCPNIYLKGSIRIDNPEDNGINTTYRQATEPLDNPVGTLKVNDIWIDTDDKFIIKTWNGTGWITAVDGIGSLTSGLNINGSFMGYYDGANWKTYMDNTGNFLLDGGDGPNDGYLQWTAATSTLEMKGTFSILNPGDINLSDLNDDSNLVKTFYTATEPTVLANGLKVGDFWFDSNTGIYRLKRCATVTPAVTWDIVSAYIDSNGLYAGTITAGQVTAGTFTGLTFQTDTGLAGHYKRVEISAATNSIAFYDSANALCGSISGASGDLAFTGSINMEAAEIYGVSGSVFYSLDWSGFIGSFNNGSNILRAKIGGGQLEFGVDATYDVNLYRSAANTLKTDDDFTANKIIKTGGTSSQFLKADGTVDSSTYVTGTPWTSVGYIINPGATEGYLYQDGFGAKSWVASPSSMVYPGAGIALSTGSAWGTSITNNSANWNTAYGWGNHASAGYLTSLSGAVLTTTNQTVAGIKTFSDAGIFENTLTSLSTLYLGRKNSFTGINGQLAFWNATNDYGVFINASVPTSDSIDIALPTVTGTLALVSQIPSLTGYAQLSGSNSFTASNNRFRNALYLGDDTFTTDGQLVFDNGTNAFTMTLSAANTAGSDKSVAFPNASGTMALQEWVSAQGYLTSISSLMVTTALGYTPASNANVSNWDTAYSWGNHASAGYVTGTPWTSEGYLTAINGTMVTTALGYTPQAALSGSGLVRSTAGTISYDTSTYLTSGTQGWRATEVAGVANGIKIVTNTLTPDYGSSANTVCQGDDSRLSDARTPASHDNTYHSTAYAPSSGFSAGSASDSDFFVATSSGGSPTTNVQVQAITINGTAYNILVKPV